MYNKDTHKKPSPRGKEAPRSEASRGGRGTRAKIGQASRLSVFGDKNISLIRFNTLIYSLSKPLSPPLPPRSHTLRGPLLPPRGRLFGAHPNRFHFFITKSRNLSRLLLLCYFFATSATLLDSAFFMFRGIRAP